ncbi:MAG: hypothetical protein HC936_11725 [Leptolyngbyaceae cyanobacterium SU_3_3]|nr:hypothetical protein [Leptolyngbyaceae cyanobacterium SU_3_3]
MNDMVGEKLDNTKTVDTATRSILATLKNTIESPILINRLNAKIANGNVIQVDGVISSLSAVLPARLNLENRFLSRSALRVRWPSTPRQKSFLT